MNIEQLKKVKKEKRMTLQEISERSGIPKRTVDQIFSGKTTNPRIDTMQAIERALGISSPRLEWTEEERAAGVVDTVQVDLNALELQWLYAGRDILKRRGEEYFKTLTNMLEILSENK